MKSAIASVKNLGLVLMLICGISFGILGLPLLVYGQTSDKAGNNNGDLKKQTNGGSLDVMVQPSPWPIGHTGPTSLKVQFLTKGAVTVQHHIDYDLIIKDSGGKQVSYKRLIDSNLKIISSERRFRMTVAREGMIWDSNTSTSPIEEK